MDEALVELTRDWLLKANHDLLNARIVSRDPEGPLDTAIYHCQQAAPSREEFDAAVNHALKLYELVLSFLPSEVRSDSSRIQSR